MKIEKRVLFAAASLCALLVLSPVSRMAFAATGGTEPDPYRNFNFRVTIDGVNAGSFAEVSGLSLEVEVVEYRSGNEQVVRKLPGVHKFGNITLKRGLVGRTDLWDWIKGATASPNSPRSEVVIELYGGEGPDSGMSLIQWELHDCFPSRWALEQQEVDAGQPAAASPKLRGNEFVATKIDIMLEVVTVSCDTMTRTDRPLR